jgi:site-specific DNA recombinase
MRWGWQCRGGDAACDNPIRIRRTVLEEQFLAEVREQLLSESTLKWAEREASKRLRAPKVDVTKIKSELADVTAEIDRVVDAITKVGISDALAGKLKTLEQRKRDLTTGIQVAEKAVRMPDKAVVRGQWSKLVDSLGNLPKTMSRTQTEQARNSIKAFLREVRVDRNGKGYADLQLGGALPTSMVAGAGFEPATFGL